MNFLKIPIKRPVTTIMMVLIIIAFGLVSYSKIPLDLFPEMNIPVLAVRTTYTGAGPSEVETLVTKPLEQVLASVSNVDKIQSTSSAGESTIIIYFVDDTDMNFAANDASEKIKLIEGMLPEDASDPMVLKIDPNAMPIMTVGVSGINQLDALKQVIDDEILNRFERIDGVASVAITGAKEKEIQVILSPEKMTGYGLNAQSIAVALRNENLNLPVGEVNYGNKEIIIRNIGEFNSIEEIKNLPIQTNGGMISLRDVAEVVEADKPMDSFAYINGTSSINLDITKQSTSNTVKLAEKINKELESLRKDFPDLEFTLLMDQSEVIQQSISSVSSTAVIGIILAVIVLFIFLRNIRSTLIIATAIPISIIFTFVLMYIFDLSINIISLGGLTLGVGMLVDNSIVVLENIYRHRQDGMAKKEAAFIGAKEVALSVFASTLTTIAVFLPLIFVEGMAAQAFKDMSLTITFALTASLLVAMTLVPMMASKLLKVEEETHHMFKNVSKLLDGWSRALDKVDQGYKKLLNAVLHHRKRSIIIIAFIFFISLGLIPMIGTEFMPAADQKMISVTLELPKGMNETKTMVIAEKAEAIIETIEEEHDLYMTISKNGVAKFTIDLKKANNPRDTKEIVESIRPELERIPGANVSVVAQEMGFGMGGATSSDISLEVTGKDYDVLQDVTQEIVDQLQNISVLREVKSSFEQTEEEAQIIINKDKAAMYGLNTVTIANLLKSNVTGQVATKYKVNGTELDVRVTYDEKHKDVLDDIYSIYLPTQKGNIPLSELAEIKIVNTPTVINRKNNKRISTINADVFGVSAGEAKNMVNEALEKLELPAGYTYKYSGDIEEMQKTFYGLLLALVLSIFLIYAILAAQFESFLHPFTIMFSVPLAITGVIIGLVIYNKPLSTPAFIGVIMLVGIVVNNAIVLMSFILQLREEGYGVREAILKAGPIRLRPILMTTMTTVLAMLPMSFGIGEGSEMMAPLAIAVIGGLTVSTLLTLVVIPLNFSIFEDFREKRALKKGKKELGHNA